MVPEEIEIELSKKTISNSLINKINSLSILVNTTIVDSKSGNLNKIRTIKDKNHIRLVEDKISYNLKTHRIQTKSINSKLITISDIPGEKTVCSERTVCSCLSNDLLDLFLLEVIERTKLKSTNYNYFSSNFFKNLFSKKYPEDLVEKILSISDSFSWIIVSEKIAKVIEKSQKFEKSLFKNDCLLSSLGKIANLSIYLNTNELDNTIYFGTFDSLNLIINKNINLRVDQFSQNKNSLIEIDYLFIESGELKSLVIT